MPRHVKRTSRRPKGGAKGGAKRTSPRGGGRGPDLHTTDGLQREIFGKNVFGPYRD